VLDGHAGPEQFTDAYVSSTRVVDFEHRVKMRVDPQIDALGYEKTRSRLIFHLRNGQEIVHDVDERYRGGPERPLSDAELEEKFHTCLDGSWPRTELVELADFVWHLEGRSDAAIILDLTNG
jgi:2-methylcitrate dehydratase PrpD